jgi:hypothetical protein
MACLYLSTAYSVIVIVVGDTTYYFEVNIYYRVVYLAFCCCYGRGWGWGSVLGTLMHFFLWYIG